jgi:ferric-dicitrate binding protein FerR (iron transport regulator)
MNSEQQWQWLVGQYLQNKITREELELLLQKVEEGRDLPALSAILKTYWEEAGTAADADHRDWDGKFREMMLEAGSMAPFKEERRQARLRMLNRFTVAASILLVLGLAGYFLFFPRSSQPAVYTDEAGVQQEDLPPGTNGAVLTLANGQQVLLDSTRTGVLGVQGGAVVVNRNGHIAYDDQRKGDTGVVYNTISTPRGRQYQVALADGSRIWLNAGSSLRYPTAFTGAARAVEITGEAYFEIAHMSGKPFVVTARGMAVEVLGTHFNINAYEDEAAIQTTLVEGSVRVSAGGQTRQLRPGQQSVVTGENRIRVQEVNTDMVTAWKNGYFSFDQTDLYAVMRQLSRWYDVDILYEGHVPDRRFGGEIPRNANASDVLKILEESKIHFKIEDKKIIVLP